MFFYTYIKNIKNVFNIYDHNPNTTNDATAVTFSVECFNPLKLYLLSRKHRQKVVCFILFYLFIINNNVTQKRHC